MGMPWADVHKIARLGRITGPFPVSRLPFPSPEVPQTVGRSNEAGAAGASLSPPSALVYNKGPLIARF